jgi:transposase-like protein
MKKSSNIKAIRVNEEKSKKEPPLALNVKDIDIKAVAQMGLQELMFQVGMMAVQQIMEAEVETLAGPRYSRIPGNNVHRWGSQQGAVQVNGQKVNTQRPRVVKKTKKGKHEEVELETYKQFSKPDAMNEAILAKMLAGVSTRDYQGTIDAVVDGHGISRSAVSRRGIKASAARVAEFFNRRFEDREFVIILIDGIGVAGIDNIVAMGIDVWGQKTVLGVRQGATENATVVTELLEDLVNRGLSASGDYLFVLDGAKALSKAVKKLFGPNPLIQRCQLHKRRNVSDKLAKHHQRRIDKRLAAAYNMNTFTEAKKAVDAVHMELIDICEPAAGSLEEGLEETLTVHRLGLTGSLKRIFSSTNSIESMFSMVRRYNRNVKKWQDNKHIERTVINALIESESRFHRVEGYRGLKELQTKIRNMRATTSTIKVAA